MFGLKDHFIASFALVLPLTVIMKQTALLSIRNVCEGTQQHTKFAQLDGVVTDTFQLVLVSWLFPYGFRLQCDAGI